MSNLFSSCSDIQYIKLNFDTSLVTDMSSLFEQSENLLEVDLSLINTENVENMEKCSLDAKV